MHHMWKIKLYSANYTPNVENIRGRNFRPKRDNILFTNFNNDLFSKPFLQGLNTKHKEPINNQKAAHWLFRKYLWGMTWTVFWNHRNRYESSMFSTVETFCSQFCIAYCLWSSMHSHTRRHKYCIIWQLLRNLMNFLTTMQACVPKPARDLSKLLRQRTQTVFKLMTYKLQNYCTTQHMILIYSVQ
jgi:hypothetical protein